MREKLSLAVALLAVALLGVLAVAGCASAAERAGKSPSASAGDTTSPTSGASEPQLVGTEWQLASYHEPGSAPVTVVTDSTLEFNGKGSYSAHACNYMGGTVTSDPKTLTFTPGMTTAMACGGEPGQLEQQFEATVNGAVGWSINASTLTLTSSDGHGLTYRVRASIYPDPAARTIMAGDRAGGQFRLAVSGPSKENDHLYLVFEVRTAPGESWGTAFVASPGPKDCLADSVLGGSGELGGQSLLAAWATPDVAKVTTQASKGTPEVPLTFYTVPGSTLRIVGLWTSTFKASVSPIRFYDKAGALIAAYPKGPC